MMEEQKNQHNEAQSEDLGRRDFVALSVSAGLAAAGAASGAGLEVGWRSLKIAPALRFTHWGPQGVHSPSTDIILNQVELLTDLLL